MSFGDFYSNNYMFKILSLLQHERSTEVANEKAITIHLSKEPEEAVYNYSNSKALRKNILFTQLF